MTVGERLRQIRKSRMITLRDVNKDLGISFSNLASLERGEHGTTLDTLTLLANYYDVPLAFILGLENDETKKQPPQVASEVDLIDLSIAKELKVFSKDEKLQVLDYINFLKSKKEIKHEQ